MSRRKCKILVIEDSQTMLDELCSRLEEQGYRVLAASGGEEGIRQMEEHKPDILITDLIMPGMDGIEVIRHVKREFPGVRIISISAGGAIPATKHLMMARKLGADFTMEKPLKWEELYTTLAIYDLTYFA